MSRITIDKEMRRLRLLLSQRARDLLLPFNQGKVGYDITAYDFGSAAAALVPDPMLVASSVNGFEGVGVKHVEDFFVVVTSGFDISGVAETLTRDDEFEERSTGLFTLHHTRSFIGWKATNLQLLLPFTLTLKLDHDCRVSRISLQCDLAGAIRGDPGCPPEVLRCVESPSALHMLVALRRAKVKPNFISYRALLSGTKKEESWCSALGML